MNRRPVQSSNIASVGWEPEGQAGRLEVEFKSGHVYQYLDVPRAVYAELAGADSVGKTLNQLVIGKYTEDRIK